jgi:hypothetical protein
MKLQKIILCVAAALTAFGASLGLLEIGSYIRTIFQPAKTEVQPVATAVTKTVFNPLVIKADEQKTAEAPDSSEAGEVWGKDDKTGDYYLVNKNPKGFEDFGSLEIYTHKWDENYKHRYPVKPYGTLYTKKDFKIGRLGIKGDKISFITGVVEGVNYHFEGKFIKKKLELYNQDDSEEASTFRIKGRLIKWQNGNKVAEALIELEIGGC